MVECSRVKWGQVEPSGDMVQCNSLTVECSRVT